MDDKERSNEELRKELGELKEAYHSLKALYEEGIAERRVAEAELSESERKSYAGGRNCGGMRASEVETRWALYLFQSRC